MKEENEGTLWTSITAAQVISELQKRLITDEVNEELAAAVILRCNLLVGELAADHHLPSAYVGDENQEKLENLARKAGWA